MRLSIAIACLLAILSVHDKLSIADTVPPPHPFTAPINQLLHLYIPDKVEFCGEPVPLTKEDVTERLDTELVVIMGNPIDATLWFKRAPRYFPMIERLTRQMGLPEDLKYVALIESNLRADAVSSAGATGPWQFMEATGASCNLENTPWRDDRRQWELATKAALKHLADLRATFGSWALALAAYNAGSARISKDMDVQNEKDFYGLKLPRETERYVLRAIAAKLIMENPAAYGIDLKGARLYEPECTDVVTLDIQNETIPVWVLAHAAGISYRGFIQLNPWIVNSYIPRGGYDFTVPAKALQHFKDAVSAWEYSHPEAKWHKPAETKIKITKKDAPKRKNKVATVYHVKKGDTINGIARQYGIKTNELCKLNGISKKRPIRPGQKLKIRKEL